MPAPKRPGPPSAPVAYVTLVRHAESRANVDRVLQGVTDAPLTPLGESQLEALEAAWRAENAFALPAPTLIASSPIGRARATANALARACGASELSDDGITHRSAPAAVPEHAAAGAARTLHDAALAERNFGADECTRQGAPVHGYPKPPASELGRAESHAQLERRVARAGRKWLDWAWSAGRSAPQATGVAPAGPTDDKSPERADGEAAANREAAGAADVATPPSESEESTPAAVPHLVLVTHGQWINTFLGQFLPHLRVGESAYYIRSANTSVFTITLHPPRPHTSLPELRLLHRNDTRHLAHLPQPSRKRVRSTQSTTLAQLWRAPPPKRGRQD